MATASPSLSKGKETSEPHNLVELCLPNSFKGDCVVDYFLAGCSDFLQMSNYSFKTVPQAPFWGNSISKSTHMVYLSLGDRSDSTRASIGGSPDLNMSHISCKKL